ncbi:MAG: hypothetical protein J3Q66DRAFT_210199 [Benniella sp.]|nr:MAG: hypothetical protein J3Q66DRAFT_210199 [Benniella sp.]
MYSTLEKTLWTRERGSDKEEEEEEGEEERGMVIVYTKGALWRRRRTSGLDTHNRVAMVKSEESGEKERKREKRENVNTRLNRPSGRERERERERERDTWYVLEGGEYVMWVTKLGDQKEKEERGEREGPDGKDGRVPGRRWRVKRVEGVESRERERERVSMRQIDRGHLFFCPVQKRLVRWRVKSEEARERVEKRE